jgi:hypothetical protein
MNFKPIPADKTAKEFEEKRNQPAIPKKPAKDPKDFPKGKRSLTSLWLWIRPVFGYLDGKINKAIEISAKLISGKVWLLIVAIAVVGIIILILK